MASSLVSRYMLFSAGGLRYAVNVDHVDGISEILPEYPIPQSPRFLRGVVNIHGKLAAVFDLSLFLGNGPVVKGCNLLLLKLPDTALAIIVEQMERMIFSEDILSVEQGGDALGGTTFVLPDGRAELLDTGKLINSIEMAVVP